MASKNFLLQKGIGKKYNVTVKQSWFIIYDSGGFVTPHIHGDCSWSCVYYVEAGKDSNEKNGSTYLQPPNVARLHSGIGSESFGFDVLRFKPDEGKLVVWPSHIVHGSLPYTGSEKRVIISANLIIDMLGLADRGKIFDLLDYIFQGNAIKALQIYNELHQAGADIIMIFDEMLNAVHFITEIKIAPNLKDDIYIPELERERGSEIAAKLTMATLGLVWQVLFKGYQELQEGFHLHQHGEMIILRLIYLHDGPTPEDLLKEHKEQDKSKSEDISQKNPITPTQINRNETINTKEENFNLPDNKNSIKSNFSITVDSYKNFVDLFYQHKEGMLHTQLYNNVKLISFKVGELTLNTDSIKDPHFNRTVAKLISKWTGRIWQIHTSTSNVGKSLYEEDLINQQKEIEKMKNLPEIKQILEAFPGVSIHSITDITETTDEKNVISIKRKEKEV